MGQTLKVHVEQIGPSATRVSVRSHAALVDRPVAKGGTDQGPLGGEYLLVALGGCFASNLLAAIHARSAAIAEVHVDVSGTLESAPDQFSAFTLDVTARHDDLEQLRKLVDIASRACAVTNTLRRAAPVTVLCEGSPIPSA